MTHGQTPHHMFTEASHTAANTQFNPDTPPIKTLTLTSSFLTCIAHAHKHTHLTVLWTMSPHKHIKQSFRGIPADAISDVCYTQCSPTPLQHPYLLETWSFNSAVEPHSDLSLHPHGTTDTPWNQISECNHFMLHTKRQRGRAVKNVGEKEKGVC